MADIGIYVHALALGVGQECNRQLLGLVWRDDGGMDVDWFDRATVPFVQRPLVLAVYALFGRNCGDRDFVVLVRNADAALAVLAESGDVGRADRRRH